MDGGDLSQDVFIVGGHATELRHGVEGLLFLAHADEVARRLNLEEGEEENDDAEHEVDGGRDEL